MKIFFKKQLVFVSSYLIVSDLTYLSVKKDEKTKKKIFLSASTSTLTPATTTARKQKNQKNFHLEFHWFSLISPTSYGSKDGWTDKAYYKDERERING